MSTVRAAALSREKSFEPATVYFVDDDEEVRRLLAFTLQRAGYSCEGCDSGEQALELISPGCPGCILLDLQLPDMSGLELRERLTEAGCRQPFIVLSGCHDVAVAVQSLHQGAIDYLVKPFEHRQLINRVEKALDRDRRWRETQRCIDSMTDREREILKLVTEGRATKEIAQRFGISARTVDVHRHNIMKKMDLESVTQLVRVMTMHERDTDD